MSHSPAISVIIPVYNVESWLRRAVGSLQNQTCTSYEILLVDDGSTDGSGALCDKLADDDVRIRVIHQENQGAAAARNAAIEIARGDYLYFMDGDDWCDRTMLKDMYRVASEHNLDLLITGFTIDTYYDDEGKYYRELRNAPDRIFESQEEFRSNACQLFDAQLLYAPWNKLYRRSWVKENGLRFDEIPCGNDRGFYFRWLAAAQSVSLLMDCGVCYQVKNRAALTGNGRWRQLDSLFFAWRSAEQAMADQPPAVRAMLTDCSMTDLLAVARSAPEEKQSAVLGQLQEFLKEVDFSPMAALPFPYIWRQVCEQLRELGTDSLTDRKCLINRVRHIVASLRIWGLRGCVVKKIYC